MHTYTLRHITLIPSKENLHNNELSFVRLIASAAENFPVGQHFLHTHRQSKTVLTNNDLKTDVISYKWRPFQRTHIQIDISLDMCIREINLFYKKKRIQTLRIGITTLYNIRQHFLNYRYRTVNISSVYCRIVDKCCCRNMIQIITQINYK